MIYKEGDDDLVCPATWGDWSCVLPDGHAGQHDNGEDVEIAPSKPRPVSYLNYDLDKDWWLWVLRTYRTLRIRVPAFAPGSDTPPGFMHTGMSYGMSRAEARAFLAPFVAEVSWLAYLGSK